MDEFQLESWHWWALGLIAVVLEAMLPTGLFAGMAIAALFVGFVLSLVPELSVPLQLVMMTVGTLGLQALIRKFFYRKTADDDIPIEERARDIMGKEYELQMAIQNNFSELEIDGVHWEIKGRDQKEGTHIRVIGLDGHMLVVIPSRFSEQEAQDAALK